MINLSIGLPLIEMRHNPMLRRFWKPYDLSEADMCVVRKAIQFSSYNVHANWHPINEHLYVLSNGLYYSRGEPSVVYATHMKRG